MEFLQQNLMWVALALVSGGMLLWPMLTGAGTESLSPAQATLLINRQDAIVLDVREGKEWEAGHIAGARHVVLSQLDNR
ncbi:MAG TPA: rhodanese-like domain-containing protein, partial [Rhodocyclaceae bacterium]|nr:rhodanese-like domain-containing protein [Rhodocyclaceae bacterium]